MPPPAFRTGSGRLTAYAFACGYIEQRTTDLERLRDGDLYTELYAEHGVYHVRQFDRREEARSFRSFWETFSTLAMARRCFNAQPGAIVYSAH